MALRRTEPLTVTREFGYVRFWRDDLVELISVMRQVSPDLTLKTDTYQLDDVEDLAGLSESAIESFEATSADRRIRFEAGPDRARIQEDDPDLMTRGMLDEVFRIARRRPRRLAPLPGRYVSRPVFSILARLVLCISAAIPIQWSAAISPIVAGFSFAILVLGFAALAADRPAAARISTHLYAEKPPWLKRNRDALITNAIVSLIFLIIGIVVGYLLPKASLDGSRAAPGSTHEVPTVGQDCALAAVPAHD